MKTILVFQTHPFGGGRLAASVGCMRQDGDVLEIVAPDEVAHGDGQGELVKGAGYPAGARRIYYPHYSMEGDCHLIINGAVAKEPGQGALNHVYVDVFFCDDSVDVSKMI